MQDVIISIGEQIYLKGSALGQCRGLKDFLTKQLLIANGKDFILM